MVTRVPCVGGMPNARPGQHAWTWHAGARSGRHTCHSWTSQRSSTPVSAPVDAPSAPPTTPPAHPGGASSSGRQAAGSSDEDFLLRARRMQRRIAKLKRLQEKIAQLKEEGEFLAAYQEVEASALDPDWDAEEWPPDGTDAAWQAAATARSPSPSSSASASASSNGAPAVPASPISSSSEELRRWVADLLARSHAAATSPGGPARGRDAVGGSPEGSSGAGARQAPGAPGAGSALGGAGVISSSGGGLGGGGSGGGTADHRSSWRSVAAAAASAGRSFEAPAPPHAQAQTGNGASTPPIQQLPPLLSSSQQTSPPGQGQGQGHGQGQGQGQTAVRRYSVRYSGASWRPTLVPAPPPHGAAPAPPPPQSGQPAQSAQSAQAAQSAQSTHTAPAQPPAAHSAPPQPPLLLHAAAPANPATAGDIGTGARVTAVGSSTAAPSAAAGVQPAAGPSRAAPDGRPDAPSSLSSAHTSHASRAVNSASSRVPSLPSPPLQPSPPSPASPTAAAPPPRQPSTPAPASATPPTSAATTAATSAPSTTTQPPAPRRHPDAELRASPFPESLTSANPYTLYDMPLPPLPLRPAWRTAAEEAEAEGAEATPPGAAGAGGGAAGAGRAAKPRDLVFVTAEVAPWSKTGGLGDVMGSLPRALAARGHRVMVVSPRYLAPSTEKRYAGLRDTGVRARLDLNPPTGGGGGRGGGGGGGVHEVGFFHTHADGVDWVFVDHMSYHREGTPYGNAHGTYGDNLFRFALLCMAACEAPLLLHIGGYRYGTPPGLPYGQSVTFVANDWHAGLVPVYVAARYRRHGVFGEARCVLALHNLAHQGAHPPHCYGQLGLPPEWYGALEWVDTGAPASGADRPAGQQRTPTINILKAALVTSDRLLTVSPAYAAEICAEGRGGGGATDGGSASQAGCGLSSLLRQRAVDLAGIVNGIDPTEWDPRTDPYIPRNYHEGSLGGKGLCKAALQEELGLPVDPAAPLLGFIGRLDWQKGPDLVIGALRQLVAWGCQVVLLGSGAADYEEALRAAQAAFPANVRAHVGFSVPLSHRILAASDLLLMPSRFEPCGLNQLYAMRYGTVPVAHGTGGLRDTIADVSPFAMEQGAGGGWGRQAEDIEELFATGLAWGRSLSPRSADDPESNNADYYEPFQDYFGASGRYGPAPEDEAEDEGAEEDGEGLPMAPNWTWGTPDPASAAAGSRSSNGTGNGANAAATAKPAPPARSGPPTLPLPPITDDDIPPVQLHPSASTTSSTTTPSSSTAAAAAAHRPRRSPTGRNLGTGWTFSPASEAALLQAVGAALAVYERHPDKWRAIQAAGMRRDSSWARAAAQWEAVLEAAVGAPAYCK